MELTQISFWVLRSSYGWAFFSRTTKNLGAEHAFFSGFYQPNMRNALNSKLTAKTDQDWPNYQQSLFNKMK